MTDAPAIRIRDLSKVFGDNAQEMMPLVHDGISKQELLEVHGHVLGLRDIELDIAPRSIQVVMGLSGSGKSTLVRHVNRLIDPTEGEVRVDDENVLDLDRVALRQFRRHRISMVFQRFALFPHRTVMENVEYGLTIQRLARKERRDRAARWVDRVGLGGYEDSYPHHLSGGMQQRVGLARALATDAEILLMDEAFSALDPLIRADMRTLLLELQAELHKTIVFVTHDLEEAIEIGDRIAILRDGEVIQNDNAQDVILKPADDYISDFTRNINRGRVLVVGSIMQPLPPGLEPPPQCPAELTLEEALPVVTTAPGEECCVVDPDGKPVGMVSTIGLMLALAGQQSDAAAGGNGHDAAANGATGGNGRPRT